MKLIRTLYTVFFILLGLNLHAQKKISATYNSGGYQQEIKHLRTSFKDSTEVAQYLYETQQYLIKKGFILASVDSIARTGMNTFYISTFLGQQFDAAHLNISPEELQFVRAHSNLNEKIISNVQFRPKEIANTMERIRDAYLQNGYPFVKVKLDSIAFHNSELSAHIQVFKGPLLKWEKVHIKGDSTLSVKYIRNLIGLKIDDLFDERILQNISARIEQVLFIEEIRPFEILYSNEGVELYLYLRSIPISSVNGVIGFQPDPASEKLTVTGDLNLKLMNVLKRGELLDIRWQSIRNQTQSLTSQLNYPYLFSSPFGIDLAFNLYKRDTTFLELNTVIGIQYFLNRGNYIKGFYENISSSVLSGGHNNPTYSNLGSTKNNMYGIGFSSSRLDYIPNPSRGHRIYIESSAGLRSFQITDTSSKEKTNTFRGKANLEYFMPLSKRHVVRIANNFDFYAAENIFENELYRFGGLNSQRGFDEDELIATTKSTFTLEYRFLLDKNSHAFAFGDLTWYENNASSYYNDTPVGFGVGFSFRTNLGVFAISYALGKQRNNPVLLRDGKVHFGYIAYF